MTHSLVKKGTFIICTVPMCWALLTVKCKIEAAPWVTSECNHASKCYHE